MILLPLVAALTLTQTSQKLTLDTGAIRVPLLLEKLSKATGTPYRSTAVLDDEVLFVDVKNIGPDALAQHIANVCHGEWEKKGDTYWLNRSAVRHDQDRKTEAAMIGDAFKAAFEQETKVKDDSPYTTANTAARIAAIRKQILEPRRTYTEDISYSTPMGRLFRRVVGNLDFHKLLELPAGQFFTFSTKPTPMQSPLPASANTALAQYLKECAAVRSIASPSTDEPNVADQMVAFYLGTEYQGELKLPAVAYLKFIRTNEDRIHFKLMVLDRDGYNMQMYQTPFYLEQKAPDLDLPGSREWLKTPVVPSPEGEALREELFNPASHVGPVAGANRPDQNELLGFLANPPLRTLAEKSGLDVIARLPDVIGRDLFRAPHKAATLQSDLAAMSTDLKFEVRNGAIEGTPTQSYRTYETRPKRGELAKLLTKVATALPTIDDLAKYVTAQRDQVATTSFEFIAFGANDLSSDSMPILRLLDSQMVESRFQLRLYASLSPPQRQAIQAEQGITFAALTPKQCEILNTLVCRIVGYLPRNYALGTDPIRGDRAVLSEPTFVYPNGVPAQALFHMQIATTPSVQIRSAKGDRYQVSTGEFAQSLAQTIKYPEHQSDNRLNGRITPANQNTYTFTLQWEASKIAEYLLTDHTLAGPEVPTWQALSDPWKKSIADLLKYFQSGPNGDGGGNPERPKFLPN